MSKRRQFEGQEDGGSPSGLKKPKIAGSAQPSFLPPKGDLESIAQPTGLPQKPASNANLDAIAAARAKIAAKFAAFNRAGGGSGAPSFPTPSAAASPSHAASAPSPTGSPAPSANANGASTSQPAPAGGDGAGAASSATAQAIAEARKRIEAMRAKQARSANPYLAPVGKAGAGQGQTQTQGQQGVGPTQPSSAGGVGQATGIHPLLAQNDTSGQARSSKDRYKPMAPKFATIKANVRQAVPSPAPRRFGGTPVASTSKEGELGPPTAKGGVNPYYDRSLAGEGAPKERGRAKQLRFNARGKYTRLAEQMRQEQKLEALKARIAEASKKAGLEGEIESGALIKRPPPPDVEWWDQAYLPNKTYEDVPDASQVEEVEEGMKMDTEADMDAETERILAVLDLSSVSALIQHPIPIPAPGDKRQQAPKALFLTKKEMKKVRRNRRAAEHKDMQDRIRMGLAPPPPDKVKISNMYRVLTQEAVSDPTKVEARVRREMQARQTGHDKANAERKLTDEQRRAKVETQKEKDEAKGIHAAVFKVRYLSDGGHRFKVRKNADQQNLSGILVFNPKFNLVYVEGGQKGMRAYTRLMTERIKWTEPSPARGIPPVGTPTLDGADPPDAANENGEGQPGFGGAEPEEPQNLAENYCYLVWEGEVKERAFRGFRPKACPADAMAKEFLGPQAGFWDIAKRYNPEDE